MIYVIAGNYTQFRDFQTWNYKYNGGTFNDCRYVRDMYDLRGLGPDTTFVVYGTWQERNDVHEIHEMIHHILSMPKKKETPVW